MSYVDDQYGFDPVGILPIAHLLLHRMINSLIDGNLHPFPLLLQAVIPAPILIDPSLLLVVLKLGVTYTVSSEHICHILEQFVVGGMVVGGSVVVSVSDEELLAVVVAQEA